MAGEPHIPVLLKETLEVLAVRPGGRYVDGTFGRGGHSRAIIAAGGEVLGIDRDEVAVAAGQQLRAAPEVGSRLQVVQGNHGNLKEIANENGWQEVDGILLDLGVSSPQLDEAGRGFSFLREGPLDMRMDRTQRLTAADLVNGASVEELTEIFRTLGEEPQARLIAKAIVARRGFKTTKELADLVEAKLGRRNGRHPATRVFQALRMAVNDELGELTRALTGGMELLAPGGRLVVITFESLSDRSVKRFFAEHVGKMRSLQQGGEIWEGKLPRARLAVRKAITASEMEISNNPRSRSAKLRAIAKE